MRRSRNGRPLRFLAVTLGGWTATRVVLLWPAALMLPAARVLLPHAAAQSSASPSPNGERGAAGPTDQPRVAPWPATSPPRLPMRAVASAGETRAPESVAIEGSAGRAGMAIGPVTPIVGTIPPPLRPTPLASAPSRLAGSAWAIVRGGGSGTVLGGQLGASQAGARLTYALGTARRVALSARFASPLRGRGKEAGLGLDWQPTRLPLHLLAEERVSLDGARGGPSLMVVGGIPPLPVLAGFRLEAYAQAGAIKRDGVEAFGDGAARLGHALATVGPVRIDVGGGAWGAAQRGVRRLDIGPTVGAVLPVAGRALRLTLDWRERIAGNARPGSGPALSLGTDF